MSQNKRGVAVAGGILAIAGAVFDSPMAIGFGYFAIGLALK